MKTLDKKHTRRKKKPNSRQRATRKHPCGNTKRTLHTRRKKVRSNASRRPLKKARGDTSNKRPITGKRLYYRAARDSARILAQRRENSDISEEEEVKRILRAGWESLRPEDRARWKDYAERIKYGNKALRRRLIAGFDIGSLEANLAQAHAAESRLGSESPNMYDSDSNISEA